MNNVMKERLTKRRHFRQCKNKKPQADEFYAYDARGEKLPGKYNDKGEFIVEMSHRNPGRSDKDGYLIDASGKKVVSIKLRDRIKKRVLQNKNMRDGGQTSRERRNKRSMSRGSLEEDVDPSQMYDYFRLQSVTLSKKAEGERAQIKKILEINKKMRQYDLKKIKDQEIEDINVSVQNLKTNWGSLRSFLQAKVNSIA